MAIRARLAAGLAMAGCGLALTAGTAAAGASTTAHISQAGSRSGQRVSTLDREFLDVASQINLTEISLGKYMRAHATTTTAKKLGASYARDHTAAQASLRALAARQRVTVPTTPSAQLRSMIARIEALKGKSRDAAFVEVSVSGHQAAIAIFRKEEGAGSNPAVKAYAAAYLPMLRTHLRQAEHAESALGMTT
jgi:putative membrane protein